MGADDDLATQSCALSAQALVRSARAEHDEARRLAGEAADLWAGARAPGSTGTPDNPRGGRTCGRHLEEAAEAARAALAAFERKGNEPGMASARALIDQVRSDAT